MFQHHNIAATLSTRFLDIMKRKQRIEREDRETLEDREDVGGIERSCALLYLYFLSRTRNDLTLYRCNEQYDVLTLFIGFCLPLLHSYGLIINSVSFNILMDL